MKSIECRRTILAAALLALALVGSRAAGAGEFTATVVDRNGVRHTVRRVQVSGANYLEFYVEGQRRQLPLAKIDRFRLGGSGRTEQAPVTVTLRAGGTLEGTMVVNAGSTPHADIVAGGAGVSDRITGSTDLGPFFQPLADVQEVIFLYPAGEVVEAEDLKATIIDERGRRFDVTDLRYRGADAFQYRQGRKRRRVALKHVARLEFGDSPGGEMRPVTITYRAGKVVQGQVDASTVRLSGEGDQLYASRVDSAFTGQQPSGTFGIGLARVKLVILRPAHETADSTAVTPPADSASAPP